MNIGWNHIPGRCCILAFSVLHTLATQIRKAGCHPAALTGLWWQDKVQMWGGGSSGSGSSVS
jgi:hypothetical protein